MHNKSKAKLSVVRFLLPLFFLLGLFIIGYSIYTFFTADTVFKDNKSKQQTQTTQAAQAASEPKQSLIPTTDGMTKGVINAFDNKSKAASSVEQPQTQQKTETLKEEDFIPAIEGQPWTAPAYAHLSGKSQIKSMPYPAACMIRMNKQCVCFTEQGTEIEEMSQSLCKKKIKKGLFNPYKMADELLPEPQNNVYSDSPSQGVQGQVQTLPGKTNLSLFDKGKVDLRSDE